MRMRARGRYHTYTEPTSPGPHVTPMLTSPGPHATPMLTSPGPRVTIAWQGQICGWPSFRSGYGPADPGFSQSALLCLLLIGLIVRGLVYLTLRFTDRARRR